MFKAVIFDLDGVIVHTDDLHYQAWQALAEEYGIAFDPETNHRLRGVSRQESLEIILEKYPGDPALLDRAAMAEKKNQYYRALLGSLSPQAVPDDVRLTLRVLRNAGLKIAIGSSSKNAPLILERIGLRAMFDAVSDGNGLNRSKPDPEVFLKAASRLGCAAADCLVVEDANAGLLAGQQAGMKTAAIGPATHSGIADYCIDRLSEVLEICGC